MSTSNPCITCGACCSTYRVSYYWGEKVPEVYYEEVSPMFRGLKNISDSSGRLRCIALEGEVGCKAICQIYESRPSPCRNFKFSYEDGKHEPRCDEARAKHGLPPLLAPNE